MDHLKQSKQKMRKLERLLPIKYGRMVASPFAFLRGSAAVMAADLADTPTTGIHVQLCGDAHISNFGTIARPLSLSAVFAIDKNVCSR